MTYVVSVNGKIGLTTVRKILENETNVKFITLSEFSKIRNDASRVIIAIGGDRLGEMEFARSLIQDGVDVRFAQERYNVRDGRISYIV